MGVAARSHAASGRGQGLVRVLGNSDDHARNHAALWDGHHLLLTLAYDIDPSRSPGWDSNQAMAYGRKGERASHLNTLIGAAAIYDLPRSEAQGIAERAVQTVHEHWTDAADTARLTREQASVLRGRQILNDGVLGGFGPQTGSTRGRDDV